MTYRVELENRAIRELRDLPAQIAQRVDRAINGLTENPLPTGAIRVRGRVGDGWRIGVGDYRILYTVDDEQNLVRIYRIRHRREAYR